MTTESTRWESNTDVLRRDPRSLRALIRRFDICSWIVLAGLAIDILGIALQIWVLHRFGELLNTYGFGHVPRDQMPNGKLIDILTKVFGVAGIAVALAGFFVAMGRARRMASEAGISGYEHGFGWTVGSIFVPILNFFRPWVGLAEIRKSILISVRERRTGNGWAAFNEVSLATLAIGLFLMLGNLGEYFYDLATHRPLGHSATEYSAWLDYNHHRMMIIIVVRIVKLLPLLIYLWTLRGPLLRLVALPTDEGIGLKPSGELAAISEAQG